MCPGRWRKQWLVQPADSRDVPGSVLEAELVGIVIWAQLAGPDVRLPGVVFVLGHRHLGVVLTGAVPPTRRVIVVGLVALTFGVTAMAMAFTGARRVHSGGKPMARVALHGDSLCELVRLCGAIAKSEASNARPAPVTRGRPEEASASRMGVSRLGAPSAVLAVYVEAGRHLVPGMTNPR